jgi:hypothetical protein
MTAIYKRRQRREHCNERKVRETAAGAGTLSRLQREDVAVVGHIGMYVSGKVQRELPDALSRWIQERE